MNPSAQVMQVETHCRWVGGGWGGSGCYAANADKQTHPGVLKQPVGFWRQNQCHSDILSATDKVIYAPSPCLHLPAHVCVDIIVWQDPGFDQGNCDAAAVSSALSNNRIYLHPVHLLIILNYLPVHCTGSHHRRGSAARQQPCAQQTRIT